MNWISTIEPAPYRIEGFDLDALRFGHCLLFERIDTKEAKPVDLWRMLNIASQPYAQAKDWLTDDINAVFSLRRWAFLKRMQKTERFQGALQLWAEWMEENTALPELLMASSGADTVGTPYLQTLFNVAVSKLNYDPQTIKEAPFGVLLWAVVALNESSGGVRVIDDNLATIFEKLQCQTLN